MASSWNKDITKATKGVADAAANATGSQWQRNNAVANAVQQNTGRDVRKQINEYTDPHQVRNRQNSVDDNAGNTGMRPFPNPADYVQPMDESSGQINPDTAGLSDFHKDLTEILWGLDEDQSDQFFEGSEDAYPPIWVASPAASALAGTETYDIPEAGPAIELSDRERAYLEAHPWWLDSYENYVNTTDNPMPFEAYVQRETFNGSPLAARGTERTNVDAVEDVTTWMNTTEEGTAWRQGHATGELDENGVPTFDYYNDYSTLVTDQSPEARAAWGGMYSDANMAPVYYEMLGTEIDTNKDGTISYDEGTAFWDKMAEYTPETLSYDPNDQYSQWIYGASDIGYNKDIYDAMNQGLQTNRVVDALINGTYDDLVASGEINALTDEFGNDLVDSLGIRKDLDDIQTLLNEEEPDQEAIDAAYSRLYDHMSRYNNAYGVADETLYRSEHPDYTGYYADYGNYTGISDQEARAMAEAEAMGNMYGLEPSVTLGDLDQQRRDDAWASGLTSTYNNIAGGNSGVVIARNDAIEPEDNIVSQANDIHRAFGLGNADMPLYYDPDAQMVYYNQAEQPEEGTDINRYTGTTVIDPSLAYLTTQSAGLGDRGFNVYTNGSSIAPAPVQGHTPTEFELHGYDSRTASGPSYTFRNLGDGENPIKATARDTFENGVTYADYDYDYYQIMQDVYPLYTPNYTDDEELNHRIKDIYANGGSISVRR